MQGKAVGLWVMPLEVLRADQLVALRGLGVLRHRAPVGHAPVGTRVPVWKKKAPKILSKKQGGGDNRPENESDRVTLADTTWDQSRSRLLS